MTAWWKLVLIAWEHTWYGDWWLLSVRLENSLSSPWQLGDTISIPCCCQCSILWSVVCVKMLSMIFTSHISGLTTKLHKTNLKHFCLLTPSLAATWCGATTRRAGARSRGDLGRGGSLGELVEEGLRWRRRRRPAGWRRHSLPGES